jgi:hypothetical protein
MTSKSKTPKQSEATKRKWGLFSKDQKKPAETGPMNPPENPPVNSGLLQPSNNDSAYGSSSENTNSMTSEGEMSRKSPAASNTPIPSPGPTSDAVETHADVTHTSPTIRREVHHNPNGTTITTTTTTTTTTTIVSGPNGVTKIEEPTAPVELDSTPVSTIQSAAVSAAINRNGQKNPPVQGLPQTTPGGRLIPQIHPNDMAGLGRLRSRENLVSPTGEQLPALPPRSPNRSSFASNNDASSATLTSPLRYFPDFSRAGSNTPSSPGPGSTFQNLKTAAAGIHGAAETLRGTLSYTADRRLRSSKTTDADLAKHQQVIDAGRYEIENGRFAPRRQPGMKVEEQQQQPQYHQQPKYQQQQQQQQQSHNNMEQGQVMPSQNSQKPSGFGKWLHKASSHPSEKRQGGDLKDNMKDKGKLRRRSDGGKLSVLAE